MTTTNFDIPDDTRVGTPSLDPQNIVSEKNDMHFGTAEAAILRPANYSKPITSSSPNHQDFPLSLEVTQICAMLLSRIIEHFSPILFTPAVTLHMQCTDVFAETWGSMVILPAIKDDGVYKPLETLGKLKDIDWAQHGLCATCVVEKRKEWSNEQTNVWNLMEVWLSASDPAFQGLPFFTLR